MLYYKEGERLSELSSFIREGSEQLVEVRRRICYACAAFCCSITAP